MYNKIAMNKNNKDKTSKNIFLNYEDKWVALSPDRSKVLVSGASINEVEEKLKGNDEDVILTYVLPFDKSYSPVCQKLNIIISPIRTMTL